MGLFNKKPKKTPEELKKERDAKISATSTKLKQQILFLEKKKDIALSKVVEAKKKGLKDQEMQARGHLKQVMASIKRENGMLMTLELAIEARDLAELNTNFLESVGTLSDEIISSGKTNSAAKTKKISDKFMRAVYESNQQKDRIDGMLAVGDYAAVMGQDSDQYSEFDDEIDGMVDNFETGSVNYTGPNKTRY